MNRKTLGLAILAALCLMPAASANTPDDPWGPDVTLVVTGTVCTTTFDLEDTLGPSVHSDANVHLEGCTQTVTYDDNSVKALCHPASTPPSLQPRVVLYGDCDVDVFL